MNGTTAAPHATGATVTFSPTFTIIVTDAYQQVRQDFYDPIEVRVDIGVATTITSSVTLSDVKLVSPNGTSGRPWLGDFRARPTTAFGPSSSPTTCRPPRPFGTVIQKSATPLLAALVNEKADGGWTLVLTNSSGKPVTLLDWSLSLPLTTNVFAVPTPVNGVPFVFPYSNQTLPLSIPGPHVVSTAVVSTGTYNVISNVYDQWTLASTISFTAGSLTINAGGPTPPPWPFTDPDRQRGDGGFRHDEHRLDDPRARRERGLRVDRADAALGERGHHRCSRTIRASAVNRSASVQRCP